MQYALQPQKLPNVLILHDTPVIQVKLFSQTNNFNYGEGTYSRGDVYGGSTPNRPNTGDLSDTGIAVVLTVTVGAILVFGAIVAKIWKKPGSKKSTEK